MKKSSKADLNSVFQKIINAFENSRFKEKNMKKSYGIVYTPQKLVDFIVQNAFETYFLEISQKMKIKISDSNEILALIKYKKQRFQDKIENLKVLDPACGSGRFLISVAKYLFKLYKLLNLGKTDFELKINIIKNNIYGVETESNAYIISKIRLLDWLYSDSDKYHTVIQRFNNNFYSYDKDSVINDLGIKFNIFNLDFLLEFDLCSFGIILGNPPYIENKKIKDSKYKHCLSERFKTAYRLYDFSILFVEKSLELLKDDEGILAFIIPNKILAANYGIKIRKLLLKITKLKELINISGFPIFKNIATYPVIIMAKKEKNSDNNNFLIRDLNRIEDIVYQNKSELKKISQNLIKIFPNYVIPTNSNLKLVNKLFTEFKPLSDLDNNLKILYRPFGFINWAKYLNNISQIKSSDRDLILLGTGNVGKYFINFNKNIKIAKNDIKVSYFKYIPLFEKKWKALNGEKLIFREIAKEPTWVYDPGIFTNVTGLYFLRIPSFDTNRLFCLLAIMNSEIIDKTFKTLYGSLHMAGGYLRFNGSFIKSLPIPDRFPQVISELSKILQFLCQFKNDMFKNSNSKNSEIDINNIQKYFKFYNMICNSLIAQLYFRDQRFKELNSLLNNKNYIPPIQVKYFKPLYDLPKYVCYEKREIYEILKIIDDKWHDLNSNSNIIREIEVRLRN